MTLRFVGRLGFALGLAAGLAVAGTPASAATRKHHASQSKGDHPVVVFSTSLGEIDVELFPDKAPATVDNFLHYVDSGFYDGTIFHRVIPGFVIQGGGFTAEMHRKQTRPPIKNEASNGLKNERGTLSMARTSDPDSATSQFFVNLKDNPALDPGANGPGYAVFGRVVSGMDVVDKIAAVPTTTRDGYRDVPTKPVVIESAHRKKAESGK